MMNQHAYEYLKEKGVTAISAKVLFCMADMYREDEGLHFGEASLRRVFGVARDKIGAGKVDYEDVSMFCKGILCKDIKVYLSENTRRGEFFNHAKLTPLRVSESFLFDAWQRRWR